MSANYTLRRATVDDVSIIAHQRASMFRDMGVDEARIAGMDAPFRLWVTERLNAELYEGWLAVSADGQIVGGAGLWLYDWIPSPLASQTRRGYILNVYTEREQRRQGIARRLVEDILAYCRAHDIQTAVLHASDQGRPIYEALGFKATSEMRLNL